MLVSLDKHCARLVEILTNRDIGCDNIAEWLQLAASIKQVEVDVIQYQKGFGFCRDADEYSIAREKLLKTFIFELARFNFVWGGLEASINNVKPPKHPIKNKRGKIRNTCYLFELYFYSKSPIALLEEQVLAFRDAAKSCFGIIR